MFLATITPKEASNPRVVTVEEELHEAINALLYSRFRGKPVTIYREDVAELIGPDRWNLEIHPKLLDQVIHRYSNSGWIVQELVNDPRHRRWSFSAA